MFNSAPAQKSRIAMYNNNALKLGLFASNCSSGRAATKVPERWDASWSNNLKLAREADAAGIDFFLPIGRWKGYPGETNFEGSTFETITWACGLLAATKNLTVFGTVHAPLVHPVYAAKQMVTRRSYRRRPLRLEHRLRLERGRVCNVWRRSALTRRAIRSGR